MLHVCPILRYFRVEFDIDGDGQASEDGGGRRDVRPRLIGGDDADDESEGYTFEPMITDDEAEGEGGRAGGNRMAGCV